MILIDTNLLLYAHNTIDPKHAAARRWLESVLSRPEPLALCWASVLGFLRIATHPTIFAQPKSTTEASLIVSEWLARPNVSILEPTSQHWTILKELLESAQVRGPLVTDAHLAALSIEHGATLCTTDRDFTRFPGLKWMNPIE